MSAATQAIEAYNRSARDLAALHRERGDLVGSVVKAKTMAYQDAVIDGANVSEARHSSDLASVHLQQEVAKLDGEIAALEVTLRYLDQLLAHERWIAPNA